MPDTRPEYDDYQRPSAKGCVVGVIALLAAWGLLYVFLFIGFPDKRGIFTYPLLALGLLILVVGGIYYVMTNRRHRAEHDAQHVQQAEARTKSDDWVSKELSESPYHSTDAQADAADQPDGK